MGIHGLLPILASITQKVHISQYSGMRVAVDAYVWLHRGAYSCSYELCQNLSTHKYLQYCMKMVHMLLYHKITPVLVFDGGQLPSKRQVELNRYKKRSENRDKAVLLLQQGQKRAAYEHFQKAVSITPNMMLSFIELLKQENVEFIVAPYEADAQLTYLSINGLVDLVISEDSDLIPYGCSKILYKLDNMGWGEEIQLSRLSMTKKPDLSKFSLEMLRYMCILSGCDYLESLPGMGIKKAYLLLSQHGDINKVLNHLCSSREKVPVDYEEGFNKANLTFRHQVVFDPSKKCAVPLRPLPKSMSMSSLPFAGEILDPVIIVDIATGKLNPRTRYPYTTAVPDPIELYLMERVELNLDSPKGPTDQIAEIKGMSEGNEPLSTNKKKRVSPSSALVVQGSILDKVSSQNNSLTQDAKIFMQRCSEASKGTKKPVFFSKFQSSPLSGKSSILNYFNKVDKSMCNVPSSVEQLPTDSPCSLKSVNGTKTSKEMNNCTLDSESEKLAKDRESKKMATINKCLVEEKACLRFADGQTKDEHDGNTQKESFHSSKCILRSKYFLPRSAEVQVSETNCSIDELSDLGGRIDKIKDLITDDVISSANSELFAGSEFAETFTKLEASRTEEGKTSSHKIPVIHSQVSDHDETKQNTTNTPSRTSLTNLPIELSTPLRSRSAETTVTSKSVSRLSDANSPPPSVARDTNQFIEEDDNLPCDRHQLPAPETDTNCSDVLVLNKMNEMRRTFTFESLRMNKEQQIRAASTIDLSKFALKSSPSFKESFSDNTHASFASVAIYNGQKDNSSEKSEILVRSPIKRRKINAAYFEKFKAPVIPNSDDEAEFDLIENA
ncbi:uncharacterized protein LOC126325491 [Schistocerca gregaria]|uniref:uncharacterized protein LOC126325491 n=1 Tax=Schistocerca gregaria TaxID=7010 RepID=UPI00211F0460|nr:uncharacterized protein LOC126325491 [Schistocerca gregaria]